MTEISFFSHSSVVEAEGTLGTDAGGESANVSGEVPGILETKTLGKMLKPQL